MNKFEFEWFILYQVLNTKEFYCKFFVKQIDIEYTFSQIRKLTLQREGSSQTDNVFTEKSKGRSFQLHFFWVYINVKDYSYIT